SVTLVRLAQHNDASRPASSERPHQFRSLLHVVGSLDGNGASRVSVARRRDRSSPVPSTLLERHGGRVMRRPEFIARQSAHPKGVLGTIIGRIMASETARDNKQAVRLLDIRNGERVLDVGTGHGVSLAELAKAAEHVTAIGVDVSDAMLAIASE